jgi:plastocyanin
LLATTSPLERSLALRRWLALAITAVLGAGVWAATSSEAASHSVAMTGFAFDPAEITVRVGDSVTWTNHDSEPHAVQGGPMNSPDIAPGATFSHTFSEAGDVSYLCRIHTYMTGVVHVVSGTPTTTSTTAAPTTTTTAPPATTTTTTAPGSTTTTTAPGATTTTTAPGATTTTTAPDSTTTTTTAPPSSGGPAFQEVPNDPSGTHPPGTPGASQPPPSGAAPTSTTTTTAPSAPPPEQDVPNDPSGTRPPTGNVSLELAAAEEPAESTGTPLGDGNQLAPVEEDDDGVKVFRLAMAPMKLTVSPGVVKDAYAFNGMVPGPVLRVDEGDKVRIHVTNNLPFPTSTHWHGMILPNEQDGVAGVTQPAIEPGETYTYEWTALAPGTHWYHTHSSGRHIGRGLYGSLEVVPRLGEIRADRDYRVLLGDTDLGFVLNGRSFPSTATLAAKVGETVRFRVINAGDQVHAMHLHGVPFDVVAQDGNPMTVPVKMDTLTISPGQTFDLVAKPVNPGKWLFHCHIFAHSHMSSDAMDHHAGMNGMVMILNVAPSQASLPVSPLATTGSIGSTRHPAGTWLSRLQAQVAVLGVMALVLIALRTGGRRSLPFTLPPRKDPV